MVEVLRVTDLACSYGKIQAIRAASLLVRPGEAVGLFGANGAGKSTLVRAITGIKRSVSGEIHVAGTDVTGRPAEHIAAQGVAVSPEGRRVFAGLSVEENLLVGGWNVRRDRPALKRRLADVYDQFPRLFERRDQQAQTLSGGEQQMLALGRSLMAGPRLLILDEPSLGLAPLVVKATYESLAVVRERGTALLVIEQDTTTASAFCDVAYLMSRGRTSGPHDPASIGAQVVEHYLGGGGGD